MTHFRVHIIQLAEDLKRSQVQNLNDQHEVNTFVCDIDARLTLGALSSQLTAYSHGSAGRYVKPLFKFSNSPSHRCDVLARNAIGAKACSSWNLGAVPYPYPVLLLRYLNDDTIPCPIAPRGLTIGRAQILMHVRIGRRGRGLALRRLTCDETARNFTRT